MAAEPNFSRAAQRIHVVQSALSASVARLEKELGVELFDRSKRQIVLTAAGEVFLEHARDVMHAAHRARTSVDAFRDQLDWHRHAGHPDVVGNVEPCLPPLKNSAESTRWSASDFGKASPGSAGHLAAIADGQMDLALVSITSPASSWSTLRELMREPMVFVCESSHPLAERQKVELADLDRPQLHPLSAGMGHTAAPRQGFCRGRGSPGQRLRSRRLCDHR